MSFIKDIPLPMWGATGTLLVAVFLGLWQWFDQRSRDSNPSPEDLDFFRRQDRRRYLGVCVMTVLAVLLPFFTISDVSSISDLAPRMAVFVVVHLVVVCGVIVGLLTLAFFDGLATRRYARRKRKSLAHERTKLMLEVLGRTGSSDSGRRPPEKKSRANEL
jgi:hypothetical protein